MQQDRERLAGLPPVRVVPAGEVRAALAGTPTVVVLDDDPTGTQTVRDLPVLTRWSADDVGWALAQGAPAFFVLTNTRSLAPDDAAARTREVVRTCLDVARRRGVEVIVASRSDSTLRGHFPLETDVVAAEVGADAVVLAPAFPDAGRVTLGGVHWLREGDTLTPVAESEFAADASFGYRHSRLADWVAEKSGGAIPAGDVAEVGLGSLRAGPVTLPRARVIVLDAVVDDDLRAGVLAILAAERDGARFVYRVGPSFVRARVGQGEQPPIADADLRDAVGTGHGLVVVGSHVARTSRQLERLGARRELARVEIDVPTVLASDRHLDDVVAQVASSLEHRTTVLSTSRTLVTGRDEAESLEIARRVSAALTGVVGRVVAASPPAYVLAKGGITSSDVATESLRADRAWVRGSLLPGIVSLWAPASGPPLVVFAGNVGGEDALADVVDRLEEAACA
ncbi:four-carbon acid sugar kinase family protein [Actinomycetospora callitridis]|uniref:four-carbon acid sugar kinase family protein n=1 Tax=Actinomycetospora callitridis TaxID=913944 RepID=UPI002366428F|nr:four-carbon acid sugar kinase family protein [Actinomycetospora callitridis]MDD7921546.1 four-carbon acid sugar kinase family protein [Actinomycetospora callitridis]